MDKFLLLFSALLIAILKVQAQTPQVLTTLINKSHDDTNRVRLFQRLGSYYLYKPGEFKNDLDSAMANFKIALSLSRKCNFKKGELNTMMLIANWYLEAKDFTMAKSYYIKVANYYNSIGDKLDEALTWKSFGDVIEYHDMPHLGDRERNYKHAYDLFRQIPGRQIDAINAYKDIADVHLNQEKYKLAEAELLEVAALFKKIHYIKLYRTYFLLGEVYKRTDNFEKRLFYRIECVKGADIDPAVIPNEKALYYFELGQAYQALKDFDQSIIFEKKSLEISKHVDFNGFYAIVAGITYSLKSEKKTSEALSFLRKQEKVHPPQSEYEKRLVALLTLQYDMDLNRYREAREVAPYLVKIYPDQQVQKAILDSNYVFLNDYVRAITTAARYYLAINQNQRAAILINKLLAMHQPKIPDALKISIYSIRYKIDSIKSSYLVALRNYEKMASIKDSIDNYAKNEEIAKMYARFKTFQKEQAIQLLNKKSIDQEVNLQKARLRQNYMTGVGILLFIITGLTFYGLRNKQLSNKKLKMQKQEINRQNDLLTNVLNEKNNLVKKQEKLLSEKDLLLKEVHHRVKNNLQIIISLINAQSAYLENNAALTAITEIQNRVHAISLIHQKLYTNSNLTAINMPNYVSDMVNYLCECLNTYGRGIRFEQLIAPISIDITQAVPLGLILNEAITNAVKYAFDQHGGKIVVALDTTEDDIVMLTIADNGKGMPSDFETKTINSLGMEMMRALSKQLCGNFQIKNHAGVTITVEFKLDIAFNRMNVKTIQI